MIKLLELLLMIGKAEVRRNRSIGLSEVAVKYGASTSVKLRYIIVLQNLGRRVSYKT